MFGTQEVRLKKSQVATCLGIWEESKCIIEDKPCGNNGLLV
jgi:hypothetical protein